MLGIMRLRMLAVPAALAAIVIAVASGTGTAQAGVLFDDEFNGSAVSPPWVVLTGGQPYEYATGQCWMNDPQHVSESGGSLSLTATYESSGGVCGTGYESGSISVPASAWSYRYGTAQARIKVPCQSGMGVWPSFWQYASQTPFNDANGEIDTMEILSSDWTKGNLPNAIMQSIHGSGLPLDRNLNSWATPNPTGAPWCGAFHVFGNTWTSNSVTFTIDGVTEHTFRRNQFSAWPLVTPQAPVLSLLVGQYGGTPSPATWPTTPDGTPYQTMLVDWIRISR